MGSVGNAINRGLSDAGNSINRGLGNATDAVGLTNYAGDRAQAAQQAATDSANRTLKEMYDQQRADMEPWRQAGAGALSSLTNNDFMNNWQQDPGYQFRLNEGNKAINAAASARGNAGGGAAMKALARYGQDYASGEYDKVYNRNNNRLSMLAGFGNNASQTNAANAGNYGSQVSGNYIGMGNAAASNQIAQANRMSGFINNGVSAAGAYFSDERLKTNIKPVPKAELNEMKKHLKAFAFNYINDKYGKGDWIGVMAQDLEKSKLGRTVVVENEAGEKTIDINKLMSLFLATMAEG